MKNNFSFNNEYYLQLKGKAMGTRIAPLYANIFMDDLERNILANAERTPSIWWRYIGGIFAIWPHGEKQIRTLVKYRNQCHPSIKFTAKWSSRSVTFLETTLMVKDEGCLTTDLYLKLTDTHQYLQRDSCHPGHCKQSIPYSQTLRICWICSEKWDYLQRTEELKGCLFNRGYNKNDVQHQINRMKELSRDALLLLKKRTNSPLDWVLLIVTNHPSLPPLKSILVKHSSILGLRESQTSLV